MSSKLTEFGRMTRKLRVEHDEYLKDMAGHLGVTPAYLSAVERGQRNAPYEWVGLLQIAYGLTHDVAERLKQALAESRAYAKLDISHLSAGDRRFMELIAERLQSFDEEER
ncbi:hypothetical protein G3A_13605 [Bacillus sp. 17376]|uniref:HTH cro/C1-type domain-containing protein n=1 Tax=Mesobacillus boroniphilus JCM 21738 TaxID=1294265 RepID=W4RSP3_9BACI|nr:helix-turn-helix domain-containing protein [Mesobacillus boroniphilus]ESU32009.1 hypothetical protein G3A_13605 [Bacillus sp. 17376]GAE47122.1 hypothetical protein JCM21738_4071 [Mesobacillus boroniphilus JCM 21738]